MRLVDVYETPTAFSVLYALLCEREDHINISHKAMPSLEQHRKFVESKPYQHWYLIEENSDWVGSVYLTDKREIGLFIFKTDRGKGYGKEAISLIKTAHPGRILANINPANEHSRAFFERQGFKLLQVTYEL